MKEKLCHGSYYASANPVFDDCTECGAKNIWCMEYVAEHNAGEYYAVSVCEECLKESLKIIEIEKELETE